MMFQNLTVLNSTYSFSMVYFNLVIAFHCPIQLRINNNISSIIYKEQKLQKVFEDLLLSQRPAG